MTIGSAESQSSFSRLLGNTRKPSLSPRNILFIAHNHPIFAPGGAEILAHSLFQSCRELPELRPFFLAASSHLHNSMHTGTAFQSLPGVDDEILFWGDRFDYFMQSQRMLSLLHTDFTEFLQDFRPDLVHFHHILRLGVEALKVTRETLPRSRIILTLHDYIPICHRDGQMVRTQGNTLCEKASPAACHQCFPGIDAPLFKLREQFIKTHFDLVDQFIAPSRFLAQRYIEWGLPEDRIVVLPNGIQLQARAPHRTLHPKEKRNRFAFFGQITPYKGVDVLLEAASELLRSGFDDFSIDIYGSASQQSETFQNRIHALADTCSSHVTLHGSYMHSDLPQLIAECDWVVAPSIWWENAPLVIDEAHYHRRPVICSGIGGMAEKVEHNKNGLHFGPGIRRLWHAP
ncbi:MAG: glycosyltransferase family 4 protein [Hyphomicrobiales bacterium]|nr:glycosyltransferase family 4 protein [Hyphomicrobiales bacterium]